MVQKLNYFPEILEAINKDPKVAAEFKDDFALKTLFKCAFDKEYKLNLPEGTPPFKPQPQPVGMTTTSLRPEMRRMYVFTKFSDVKQRLRLEQMYVQLLESIHPSEVKVLTAMKDQQLDALYPKINAEFIKKHFPDVLPEGTVVAEPAKKSPVKKVAKSADQVG